MPARSQFAAAIAQAEGFNSAGSLPQRNNNPGDLKGWPGVPTDASGYSVFPTEQAGWDALQTQLNAIAAGTSAYYTPDMTIAQMGQVWAGGDPNWAVNVAAYLGVSSGVMIGSLLGMAPGYATLSPAPAAAAPIGPVPSVFAGDDMQTALMVLGIGFGILILRKLLA